MYNYNSSGRNARYCLIDEEVDTNSQLNRLHSNTCILCGQFVNQKYFCAKMKAAILFLATCLPLPALATPRFRRQTQNCFGSVCQQSGGGGGAGGGAELVVPPGAVLATLQPGETRPLSCGGGARGVATSCSAHSCGVTCGDGTQVRSSSFQCHILLT